MEEFICLQDFKGKFYYINIRNIHLVEVINDRSYPGILIDGKGIYYSVKEQRDKVLNKLLSFVVVHEASW